MAEQICWHLRSTVLLLSTPQGSQDKYTLFFLRSDLLVVAHMKIESIMKEDMPSCTKFIVFYRYKALAILAISDSSLLLKD